MAARILGIGLIVFVIAALWARMLHLPLSHDEHQFVAAGALIEDGLMPYRDFPFHHVPNLAYVYAVIDGFSERLFLNSRIVSFLAATASALLVFQGVRIAGPREERSRLIVPAAVGALAFVGSPLTAHTSGRAWNHDVPVALALASIILISRRAAGGGRLFGAGLLAGFAIGTRASFFPLALITIVWLLARSGNRWVALKVGGFHAAGLTLGLLPTLVSVLAWPREFFFDNWTYTRLNTAYQTLLGYQDAMSVKGKLAFTLMTALEPVHVAVLAIGAVGSLVLLNRDLRARESARAALLYMSAGIAILAGSLIPTPSWPQYLYDPLPFLIIPAVILGVQAHSTFTGVRIVNGLAALTIGVFGISALLNSIEPLVQGRQTAVERVEGMAREVARNEQIDLVITLAPIIPLEAGLQILPELASGPFSWRVSPLYSHEQWIDPHVLHPDEFERLAIDRRSTAILTGFESGNDGFEPHQKGGLEVPLQELATRIGLEPTVLETEFERPITLWLPGGDDV